MKEHNSTSINISYVEVVHQSLNNIVSPVLAVLGILGKLFLINDEFNIEVIYVISKDKLGF